MSKFILSALPTMPALIAVDGEESRFSTFVFRLLGFVSDLGFRDSYLVAA
jgi:hypothetical protein